MYQVAKRISFCYGHRLLKHKGKCFRYHGHNALAEILCQRRTLDSRQMVVDFDKISETIRYWINDHLDHRMILNKRDPLVPYLKKWKEPHFCLNGDPTSEAISKLIFQQALIFKLPVKKVVLWETPSSFASYEL